MWGAKLHLSISPVAIGIKQDICAQIIDSDTNIKAMSADCPGFIVCGEL